MTNIFVRKLEAFGTLPASDRNFVESIVAYPEVYASETDIIREGDVPNDVNLIISGFACRYKLLESGRRQIVAYLLPGDFCDLHVCILDAMDHSIATLSEACVAKIPRDRVEELLARPAISRALLMATLVDEATLREWLANLGQRPAEQRLAHLFCELYFRLEIIGLTQDGGMELPLTQTQLGDTTGLSTVHVNRSLQSLRAQGLIALKSRRLKILDLGRLQALAGFRANYLHFSSIKSV